MAKDKTTLPEDAQPQDGGETIEDVSAKADALAEQVASQQIEIDNLKSENASLRVQIELLSENAKSVANSVSFNPPAPAAPERPVVEIDGVQYRFKVGEVRLSNRDVRPATVIAADETLLSEVFGKFPGLFQEV